MKKIFASLVVTSTMAMFSLPVHAETDLNDARDKLSYSVGVLIGSQLTQDFDDLSVDALMDGIMQQYNGDITKMTLPEAFNTVNAYQQVNAQLKGQEALAESELFLEEKAQEEGVQVTDSGLQYKIIKQGNGAKPTETDKVTVHYRGTLKNGREFDSSYTRGEPATFPVNGVIPGWIEGLQLLQEGTKVEFYIHPDLAYGERGAGEAIGPNEALVFEVELISIEK